MYKNMKKQVLRLTEEDLQNIIKESVNNILSELDWKTYDNAMNKSDEHADNQQLRQQERKFHRMRGDKFGKASNNNFYNKYGITKFDASNNDDRMARDKEKDARGLADYERNARNGWKYENGKYNKI